MNGHRARVKDSDWDAYADGAVDWHVDRNAPACAPRLQSAQRCWGGENTMADNTIDLLKNYLLLEPDGDGGSASRWRGLLEPVDVRRCDGFWHPAADGQREGAAVIDVLYGRRLDQLGNASSR
jgi:hypothetical protein